MLPIRTILYSTGYSKYSEYAFADYSEHSEYAFQVACELARDYEARLIVLHVVDTIKSPRGRGDDRQVGSSWSGNNRDSLRKKLYRLKSAYPAVRLEHQLREGSPVEEILRAADEDRCDLIVMGAHRPTGLDRLLMGSVAEKVLRLARCPVLVVKSPPARQPREPVWAEYGFRRGVLTEGELERLGSGCDRAASQPRPRVVVRKDIRPVGHSHEETDRCLTLSGPFGPLQSEPFSALTAAEHRPSCGARCSSR